MRRVTSEQLPSDPRVAPERLDALTAGVNRLNASLAALDALDLKDCERAETLDVLTLKVENVPEA